MKTIVTWLFAALLLSALLNVGYSHDEPEEGEPESPGMAHDRVTILSDDNFSTIVTGNDFALVEFYAPWCGHCQSLQPEYVKVFDELTAGNPPVRVAKVDATKESKLAEKYEIQGFPTLKFFLKDSETPIDYNGERTAEAIIKWVNKKLGPAVNDLQSPADFAKALLENEVAVIFFGPKGSEEAKTFNQIAAAIDDTYFGQIDSKEVAAANKVTQTPSIVLFKHFDEKRNDYSGEITQEDITKFIQTHQYPKVMKFNEKAAQRIFSEGLPALFLFIDESPKSQQAIQALKAAADKITTKIVISTSGLTEELENSLAEYVGITADMLPTIRLVLFQADNSAKFALKGDDILSPESILEFVQNWQDGKLDSEKKSEEIPESNDGPVKVLVGKNHDDIVMDPSKDVLVEYYAPWCGHCKEFAPTYEKIGEKVANIPNLILAKMDATANDVEGVNIQGFPTIKFYPSNNKKEPIDYEGDRTEDEVIEFLKKHITIGKKEDL